MKRIFAVLFLTGYLLAQETPSPAPAVSDKTRADYFLAIAHVQASDKRYADFPEEVKKMIEAIQKARTEAYAAAQAAYDKASAECGAGFQVDGDALQRADTFVCIPAPKK